MTSSMLDVIGASAMSCDSCHLCSPMFTCVHLLAYRCEIVWVWRSRWFYNEWFPHKQVERFRLVQHHTIGYESIMWCCCAQDTMQFAFCNLIRARGVLISIWWKLPALEHLAQSSVPYSFIGDLGRSFKHGSVEQRCRVPSVKFSCGALVRSYALHSSSRLFVHIADRA